MTKTIRSGVWLAAFVMAIAMGVPAAFADDTPAVAPSTTLPSDGNFKLHPAGNINCAMRVGAMVGKRCDVIFIGDSITQHFIDSEDGTWNLADGVTVPGGRKFDLTGRAVWEKHYAGRHVLNFGVGSDGTEHMLWRMDNMSIAGFKPKVAVILAGTNDTKFPPDQIAMGVHAIVQKTRAMFPQAKIILISILPNARAWRRPWLQIRSSPSSQTRRACSISTWRQR